MDDYSLGNRSKPEDRGWVFQRGVQGRMERRVSCHQGITSLKRLLPYLANFATFTGTISHRPCRPFPPRSSHMANPEGQVSKFSANSSITHFSMQHPNILPLLGASSTSSNPPWFFVSPYMRNGSAVSYLRAHPGQANHLLMVIKLVPAPGHVCSVDPSLDQ